MAAQDQTFKDLLQAFFREFVELFYPAVAARLDFGRVDFLDKETFTDVPEGSRREADLVARVHTHDGQPELLLFHVEVQTQRRGEFGFRMWEYYALLRLRHKLPVFPVVVYLAAGAGGVTQEHYTESLFGQEILRFCYQAVGLPDLNGADYEARDDNPLAPALSVLMRPGPAQRRARRWALLLSKRSVRALDEARQALLFNLWETYLPLGPREQTELRQLLGEPQFEEVRQVTTMFERWGIEKGIEQGIEQGVVRGKRDTLLRLARRKFGVLPPNVVTRIEATAAEAQLDVLLDRVLTAASPSDLLRNEDENEQEQSA